VALDDPVAEVRQVEDVIGCLGPGRDRVGKLHDLGRRARLLDPVTELRRGLLQPCFAFRGGGLSPFHRGAPQLDGSKLLPADGNVSLQLADPLLARTEVEGEGGELGVPLVELGRAVTEHLLDGAAESAGLFLTALEILDRHLKSLGLLLELAAPLDDECLDRLLVLGVGEERLQPVPDPVVRSLAARPVLPLTIVSMVSLHAVASVEIGAGGRSSSAVEFGTGPPAPCTSTGAQPLLPRKGDADAAGLAKDRAMDTIGARHLQARLRAGVRVGTRIVLERDDAGSGLCAGDRGVVNEITLEGVVVDWDKGFRLVIDPVTMPYSALAAA
jgi:hypothetical protein